MEVHGGPTHLLLRSTVACVIEGVPGILDATYLTSKEHSLELGVLGDRKYAHRTPRNFACSTPPWITRAVEFALCKDIERHVSLSKHS